MIDKLQRRQQIEAVAMISLYLLGACLSVGLLWLGLTMVFSLEIP